MIIKIPIKNVTMLMIKRILEFFKPEYLNTSSSLLLNRLIKNNWVEIKKMNGNISNIIEGEFNTESNSVNSIPTSISLKKSNSDKIFRINTKLNMIIVT